MQRGSFKCNIDFYNEQNEIEFMIVYSLLGPFSILKLYS